MPELLAIQLVPLETIERIVIDLGQGKSAQSERVTPAVPGSIARQIRLIEKWSDEYGFPGILFVKEPDSDGVVIVVLESCPRDESHIGTSAALAFFPDGGRACCCHHHSCQALKFREWWGEVEQRIGRKMSFERTLFSHDRFKRKR